MGVLRQCKHSSAPLFDVLSLWSDDASEMLVVTWSSKRFGCPARMGFSAGFSMGCIAVEWSAVSAWVNGQDIVEELGTVHRVGQMSNMRTHRYSIAAVKERISSTRNLWFRHWIANVLLCQHDHVSGRCLGGY